MSLFNESRSDAIEAAYQKGRSDERAANPHRLTTAEARYRNDPVFHAIVNHMRAALDENQIDAGSLVVAAVEAANMHLRYRAVPRFVVIREGGEP